MSLDVELAARIANPAVFAAADDLTERIGRALASPDADLGNPDTRRDLLLRISVIDMLADGYRLEHVAREHDMRVLDVARLRILAHSSEPSSVDDRGYDA